MTTKAWLWKPGTLRPTLYDKRVGAFTSPANHFNISEEEASLRFIREDLKV